MNLAEKIYYYTNHYHYDNVKCVLARENWAEKDFDVKYVDYVKDFIKFFEQIEKFKLTSKERCIEALEKIKQKRIEETYEFLSDELINLLTQEKHISEKESYVIRNQLDSMNDKKSFNINYIKKIRKIEEKYFSE